MALQKKAKSVIGLGISACIVLLVCLYSYNRFILPNSCLSASIGDKIHGPSIAVIYPFNGTLFPPEMCAPTVRWNDPNLDVKRWSVSFVFMDGYSAVRRYCDSSHWTPSNKQWESIKRHSKTHKASIVIVGIRNWQPASCGKTDIQTSNDSVGAPLFYREVILPFKDAVKDPSKIRWRFGSITRGQSPPIVLENLPVCGNCHSFSADGATLGMDVDYANDKGAYAIVPVSKVISLDSSNIISWNDYRKQDREQTFGLLSQVSPDGKWVASTVKDLSVFVPKPQLDFSQLFFPVKGIIAVYNRSTRMFSEVPGASDRSYVQSNPVWSVDGKRLLFIRNKMFDLNLKSKQVLLSEEQCAEFLKNGKLFLYDIYQVPFNDGKGGEAIPLPGASANGMSNYFPKFSPDGKWVVFCKAKSFSLLQPDSKLYIIPASGGAPRLMNCNRNLMNSWHSFSPNGKWMVFSSKAFSFYTQLFLTHIDENGDDTPPVALEWLTAADRAANIPEFVNASENSIMRIQERFVNDVSYLRAAKEYVVAYDLNNTVINLYHKALSINPKNAQAHYDLGTVLAMQHQEDDAMVHFREAISLDNSLLMAYCNLATAYASKGDIDSAAMYFRIVIDKNSHLRRPAFGGDGKSAPSALQENDIAVMNAHTNLAAIYARKGAFDKAVVEYATALEAQPLSAELHCDLADIYLLKNDMQKARNEYNRCLGLNPRFKRAYHNLSVIFQKMNMPEKSLEMLNKANQIKAEDSNVE